MTLSIKSPPSLFQLISKFYISIGQKLKVIYIPTHYSENRETLLLLKSKSNFEL
jgi:hypothetical protein